MNSISNQEQICNNGLSKFRQVYADALGDGRPFEETADLRSLRWRGERTTLADAAKMFAEIRFGYNEFSPNMLAGLLAAFPEGIEATPAREYSVAVYLHPLTPDIREELKAFVLSHFHADEVDWETETSLRVWWD